MAGVDRAVQEPWVDPHRIGVAGGSYGGFLVNWLLGHTDQFAAAVTERGHLQPRQPGWNERLGGGPGRRTGRHAGGQPRVPMGTFAAQIREQRAYTYADRPQREGRSMPDRGSGAVVHGVSACAFRRALFASPKRRTSYKKDNILPALGEGDTVLKKDLEPKQHFTQPPPRYTEARLVKTLEELGNRPSVHLCTDS